MLLGLCPIKYIDTDIEALRRGEVKKYMEVRFGESQVISVGTYTAMQLKASLKDLGRIYNLSFDEVNYVTGCIEHDDTSFEDFFASVCGNKRLREFVRSNPELINSIPLIIGQPKAKSVHACAMVIFPKEKDMFGWAPIMKQGDLYVSEWEGAEMEQVGFLKEDILGVKQLDKFRNIINLIKKRFGSEIDIYKIPYDDEVVYRYFRKGYNGDVFHFGSQGLTKYCTELLPDDINDLVAGISLYRPGAIENNFHNEYVMCKNGDHEVTIITGTEDILGNTYGVFVYQEQIMKLCQVLGGLSLVEADDVRKAMVKKKYEELTKYKERFLPYYIANFHVTPEYAMKVWDQIDKASTYLFNKCISGDEKIKSLGVPYKYTIGEMWKLRNDPQFYKTLGLTSDNYSYMKNEYGYSWSLCEDGKLRKNKIKDIRFEGVKDIYRMTLVNSQTIDVTKNHKFPTSNGEKLLLDLEIGVDKIYFNKGYIQEDTDYRFTDKGLNDPNYNIGSVPEKFVLNSVKGVEGFVKKGETGFKLFEDYRINHKKDYCEICTKTHPRLEIHHKNGVTSENEHINLITLCPSCHKKEHYKMGRTKIGEKGLYTELLDILSIEFVKVGEVYDVEMENPYHTFVTQNDIVTSNSHAAAYAITGYISQWFKVHYPLEYWVTAFEFMSQDDVKRNKVSQYISEIHRTGAIKIFPVDINESQSEVTSSKGAIYWSLSSIKQVGDASADQIMKDREANGNYFSFDEFLSRHSFTGSKVNKSVIENLIFSGAFDKIENIESSVSRKRLIDFYRIEKKVKIEDGKDILKESGDSIYQPYWWDLQQRRLSSIAFFDYEDLCNTYLKGDFRYLPQDDFQSNNLGKDYYAAGGYVLEVIERESSKKGKYCAIRLDSNSEPLNVTIFPDQYKLLTDSGIQFVGIEGSLLILSGMVKYEDYKKCNTMKVWSDSEIAILK